MCSSIENTTNQCEWHSLSHLVSPSLCPHLILNHKTKQTVRLAKFSVTALIGHYRIRQREHPETFPPSCCLVPFGSLSKCPSALCSSSKNRGGLLGTGAVCENVLLAFSLPGLVISALQTLSIPWTLLCQLFFIMVRELEANSGTAVYRDSLSPSEHRAGFLPFLSCHQELRAPQQPGGNLKMSLQLQCPPECTSFFKCIYFLHRTGTCGWGIKNQESKSVVGALWTL